MKPATDIGRRLILETLEWPDSWKYDRTDVPTGQAILKVVTPFLQHLVDSSLAAVTLRRHFSNIWLLGGKIIKEVNKDSELRSLSIQDLVFHFINENGGPLSQHLSTETEQRSFDSSCRKLYHFLFTQASKLK